MKLFIYQKRKQWDCLFSQKQNGWLELGTQFLINMTMLNVRSNVSGGLLTYYNEIVH